MSKRTGRFFNRLILLASLLVYLSVLIPPSYHWLFGFVSFLIPGVLLFNFLLFISYVAQNKKLLLYPFASLLIGLPFIKATLAIHPDSEPSTEHSFSIMSYNVRNFMKASSADYKEFSEKSMDWVTNDTSDIKCFQEFHSFPARGFDMFSKIKKDDLYYSHHIDLSNNKWFIKGLAIFSKFPIINQGSFPFDKGSYNGAIFADIVIGKDTLRLYNLHLRSMGIETDNLIDPDPEEKFKQLVKTLKQGLVHRANQIKLIVEDMEKCPYQKIVVGDFNDVPYSYTYFRMKRKMKNAFEERGNGFGFTYNGKLEFLRIDNQFFDNNLEITHFETIKEVPYSDHFPLKGIYNFAKN